MSLLSIGYGNRPVSDFLRLLHKYQARFVIDVRSKPFSRTEDYNRDNLDRALADEGIKYVFMGDSLGGRPSNFTVYSENGQVIYDEVRKLLPFQVGIQRLARAASLDEVAIIMCSELRPTQCHRAKLVGEVLREQGVTIAHIDANGQLVSQEEVMQKIKGATVAQPLLFPDSDIEVQLTSKKHYKIPQGATQIDDFELEEETYSDAEYD